MSTKLSLLAIIRIALALAVATVATASAVPPSAVEFSRVRGNVSFQAHDGDKATSFFGTVALGRSATVLTDFRSRANMQFPDSSTVEIGDRTTVHLADLPSDPGAATVLVLDRGAIRLTVRHPEGARSNYIFQTPTTNIAVRGTRAYLVTGPGGTQLYCVECDAGDITVTTVLDRYSITSGQSLNVRTIDGKAFDAAIVPNATINNPAVDQFLDGFSPFGQPFENGTDFTGSGSGTAR